jgi:hypothetical protein
LGGQVESESAREGVILVISESSSLNTPSEDAIQRSSLFGSDEEKKERVREVIAAHVDELDGYETSDEPNPNSNPVYFEFELTDREPDADDEEFVEAVSEEMVRLVEFYHPKLTNQFTS